MAADHGHPNTGERTATVKAIRYGLPALVALAGLIVMCLGSESDLEGGAGILSAGLAIYFVNWLFRMGVDGERERDAERSAREHFDIHGHWPDEPAGHDRLRREAAQPPGGKAAVGHRTRERHWRAADLTKRSDV